jgi:hypothetical protein
LLLFSLLPPNVGKSPTLVARHVGVVVTKHLQLLRPRTRAGASFTGDVGVTTKIGARVAGEQRPIPTQAELPPTDQADLAARAIALDVPEHSLLLPVFIRE